MTIMRATVIIGLCFPYIALCADFARTIDVTLRIDARIYPVKEGEPPQPVPVLSRSNLIAIQQFILKQGRTQTYCQMYNNNPYFPMKNDHFYLNPDTGQRNINCDPEKSGFHTLVIRNRDRGWDDGRDQYRYIEFKDEYYIYIHVSWPADDLDVGKIRYRAEKAIEAILDEMKRMEKASPGSPAE